MAGKPGDKGLPRVLPKTDINPGHYGAKIKGNSVQAVDVMEGFFPQDAHLSQAFKYMARAGRKPESSYLKDVGKALWWLCKAIMYHGGKIELPPGAKQ